MVCVEKQFKRLVLKEALFFEGGEINLYQEHTFEPSNLFQMLLTYFFSFAYEKVDFLLLSTALKC